MGRSAVLKKMQNYEPDLVRRLGDAIYASMDEIWKRRGQAELMTLELVEHSNEEMQYLEQNKELVKIGGTSRTHDFGACRALKRGDAVLGTKQGVGQDRWSRGVEVSCTSTSATWTSQWCQTGPCSQDQAHVQ
eukprot:s2473_g5.t1